MAAGYTPYQTFDDDVPWPRAFLSRSMGASANNHGDLPSLPPHHRAAERDSDLGPIAPSQSTIANMATRIVRAKGAQMQMPLGNGRTRVLGAGAGVSVPGQGTATAAHGHEKKQSTQPAKEKQQRGSSKPPWRAYFNYTKPDERKNAAESNASNPASHPVGSPGRSRSRSGNRNASGDGKRCGPAPNIGSVAEHAAFHESRHHQQQPQPTHDPVADAERFRRRVAEIQDMRNRQTLREDPEEEDNFRFDYGDYFRSPGGRSESGSRYLTEKEIAERGRSNGAASQASEAQEPGARVQQHLFGSKPSPAASSRPPTAARRENLAASQPSFASVGDDNFATFAYDPKPAPSLPMASPGAARPHTTQNSPYHREPLSPPYNPNNQARSATSAGFAPTHSHAQGQVSRVDLAPRPEEYVFQAPAPGLHGRGATAIGRPSPLRTLDLLPPKSIEIQPPCFHSLQSRLQIPSFSSLPNGRTIHAGFLLGRNVADASIANGGSKLLLDRFDVGRRESVRPDSEGGERWEPTVVIKGDVVVPVVFSVGNGEGSPFGVAEWEKIVKTFESYMFTSRSRLPSLLCPIMGIVDANSFDLIFRSLVPIPSVTVTPIACSNLVSATNSEEFGFLAVDAQSQLVRMDESDPRFKSAGASVAGIWIGDARDLTKAVTRFAMRRCWSRLESAPMEDPERAAFLACVISPDREPQAYECIQIPPIMTRDRFPFALMSGTIPMATRGRQGGNVRCGLARTGLQEFGEDGFRSFALRRWGIELPFEAPPGPPSPILPRSPRKRGRSNGLDTRNMLDGLEDVSQVGQSRQQANQAQPVSDPAPIPSQPQSHKTQPQQHLYPPAASTAVPSTFQSANVSQAATAATSAQYPARFTFPFGMPPMPQNTGTATPAEFAQLQMQQQQQQQQQMWMAFMTQMMARMGMPGMEPAASTAQAPSSPAVQAPQPAVASEPVPSPTYVDVPDPAPQPAAPRRRIMTETATNTTIHEPSGQRVDSAAGPPASSSAAFQDLRSVGTNTTFVGAKPPIAPSRDRPSGNGNHSRPRFPSNDSPDRSVSDIDSSMIRAGVEAPSRARPPPDAANGQPFFELSMPVEDGREADTWAFSDAGSVDVADSASNAGRDGREEHRQHRQPRTRSPSGAKPVSSSHRARDADREPSSRPAERRRSRMRSEDPTTMITELCSDPEKSFILVESRKLKGFRGHAPASAPTGRGSRRAPIEREDSSDDSDDRASMTTEEEDIRANLIASRYLPRNSRHHHAPVSRPAREPSRPRHGTRTAQLREEASISRADMSFASLKYLQKYGLEEMI